MNSKSAISSSCDGQREHFWGPGAEVASAAPAVDRAVHRRAHLDCACSCKAVELAAHFQHLLSLCGHILGNPERRLPDWGSSYKDGVDNILHYATRFSTISSLYQRILWEARRGNGIDARDCDGMTALEIAVRRCNAEVAKTLLLNGASYRLCSMSKETMLHLSMISSPNYRITAEIVLYAFLREGEDAIQWYRTVREVAMTLANRSIDLGIASKTLAKSYRTMYLIIRMDGQLSSGRLFTRAGWSVHPELRTRLFQT